MMTFILSMLLFSSFAKDSGFYALFSPHQGDEAFNKIYEKIENAKEYVYLTIYSWSDKKVADAIKIALTNDAKVRIVLHKPLYKKSRVKEMVREIELLGAQVKISNQNMHEKFLIVDDKELMNSSANLSTGARTKYSENFIFHDNRTDQGVDLINEFKREFAILFNAAKDVLTIGEAIANSLPIENYQHEVNVDESTLYSSSMNFELNDYTSSSSAYKQGRYLRMSRIKNGKEQIWTVRDRLIEAINNAKRNIFVNLNHLNIEEVAIALVEASKRGVDVKLVVDNQEFKTRITAKEKTPLFVNLWKKIPQNANKNAPVRVKFYSHAPSPRFWFLNHHKTILIDYDKNDTKDTLLISGSYNISKNAEHRQYDNLVFYQGDSHTSLHSQFKAEFDHLWSLNRDENDQPDAQLFKNLYTPNEEGMLYVHSKEPISLTWKEVKSVRSKVSKIAKGIYYKAFKNRNCYLFNTITDQYTACPN